MWFNTDDELHLMDEIDAVKSHYSKLEARDAKESTMKGDAKEEGEQGPVMAKAEVDEDVSRGGSQSLPLAETRRKCEFLVDELDEILGILDVVTELHDGVTSRSNRLMINCEALLEEQASLQETVEKLKEVIGPFDDIEGIAVSLGIPFDAHGKASAAPSSSSTSLPPPLLSSSSSSAAPSSSSSRLDPRSSEFKSALSKLARALSFVYKHQELRDADKYSRWLEQLQQRATSMVARAMQDLLNGAQKTCHDMAAKQATVRAQYREEVPLESQPLYQKFRGLSFRMRELSALLVSEEVVVGSSGGGDEDINAHTDQRKGKSQTVIARKAMAGVREAYVVMRTQLMLPALKESLFASNIGGDAVRTTVASGTGAGAGASTGPGLCSSIRKAYGMVLRITQLEKRLLDSLFLPVKDRRGGKAQGKQQRERNEGGGADESEAPMSEAAEAAAATAAGLVNELTPELTKLVQFICSSVGDMLRPHIIREGSIDELCRAITTLAEDVRSQMYAGGASGGTPSALLPRPALKLLMSNLDRTVSDCQERLSYCTERWLRVELKAFRPEAHHLDYPAILQGGTEDQKERGEGELAGAADDSGNSLDELAATWYPPLRLTLGLLSKLYGVLDPAVFEDVARRAIHHTVDLVQDGAAALSRRSDLEQAKLHSTLFLVRHLLLLREQLLPFEMRLQSIEKRLDFSTTGMAFKGLVSALGSAAMYSFSQSNALLMAARQGLPTLLENTVDARRDLDGILKEGCAELKATALDLLLSPVESFLAKASAFCGDIPIVTEKWSMDASTSGTNTQCVQSALEGEVASKLLKQSFAKPGRLQEVVEEASTTTAAASSLLEAMDLYMENPVARGILLRPVAHECKVAFQKLKVIIATCVEGAKGAELVDEVSALEARLVEQLH